MDSVTLTLFILGFVLLAGGAELLLKGASDLAETLGISPLVIGLTVVAFGTSAPELAVNLQSAWAGQSDIAVGNVIGSNILNILLVLGIGALIAPLSVHKRLIQLEVPVMIGVSVALLLLSLDGALDRWNGLLLSAGFVFYTFFAIKKEYQSNDPAQADETPETGDKSRHYNLFIQLLLIIVGLGLLVLGSQWLVDGAIAIAKLFGISELIIGLTIISIGTSLPEIATVVIGCLRGKQEMVVGNVVGSNLFNILLVLGFTALVSPAGLEVAHAALVFDMPIMIAVAVACLPIFFTGYLIERWEGSLFLVYYLLYTTFLFLNATQHSALAAFNSVMFWFVIPITVVTLLVLVLQSFKAEKQ